MAIGVSNLGAPEVEASSAAGRPRRRQVPVGIRVRRNVTSYLFLAGALLCFSFVSWYPMVRDFVISQQKAGVAGLALVLGFMVPFLIAVVLTSCATPRPISGCSSTCRC